MAHIGATARSFYTLPGSARSARPVGAVWIKITETGLVERRNRLPVAGTEFLKRQVDRAFESVHLVSDRVRMSSALGRKGLQVAESLAVDGVFAIGGVPEGAEGFPQISVLAFGSVLDDGERLDSDRLRDAAGPGLAQAFHVTYELAGEDAVRALPGGAAWLTQVHEAPEHQRHLAVHTGHLLHLNDADSAAWSAGAHALIEQVTLTGTADDVLEKVQALAATGVTEIVYQPAGDIRRELEAFAAALGVQH